MKQKILNLIEDIKARKIKAIMIVATTIFLGLITVVSASLLITKEEPVSNNGESVSGTKEGNTLVGVVGEDDVSILGTGANNSWSGEIISLNNLQVQPDREGTISQWYVKIGERVSTGQVIGKLSRPPQTPEMVSMLSEKSQMASESRTTLEALRTYTEKRITQLKQLRIDTEKSNKQKIDLLGSDTDIGTRALLSSIETKRKMAQAILRDSISKTIPIVSYQTITPTAESIFSIQVKWPFGVVNPSMRNSFISIISTVLADIKNSDKSPEKSGILYFDTAIKLANSSVSDGELLPEASLESLKQMLTTDQSEFISAIGEIKSMEIERADIQRESIDTLAEIDAMIAELEKELAMSEGDAVAKEAAYATVRSSITGGYSIVAPNSGIVSSIMKKPGEFVGPGMPVATVTAEGIDRVLVRVRIPNNVQKPKIGEMLSIIRPGFGKDIQKVRLVGVGSSLDDGSYMADAVFIEDAKWPIGASVRVFAAANSSNPTIRYSSVVWSEGGIPMVWAVSEGDRIFTKKITIGRTFGNLIEVYSGISNGDRYILDPVLDIKENMFLDDLIKIVAPETEKNSNPDGSSKDGKMGGMEM